MADFGKQDHLMKMIDQLDVGNLSVEAVSLLAGMADSIRSALEKGQLLEQLIINQKNNIQHISRTVVPANKESSPCAEKIISQEKGDNDSFNSGGGSSKKKKRKKNKSAALKNKDDSISQTADNPSFEKNMCMLEPQVEQKLDSDAPLSNTSPNLSGSNDNKTDKAKPIIQLVELSRLQEEKNSTEEYEDLVPINVYISKDFFQMKQEPPENALSNHPVKSFAWDPIFDESSKSSHEYDKPPSDHDEQPMMPTPIFIKTEPKCPNVEHTTPNLILNISNSNENLRSSDPTPNLILNTSEPSDLAGGSNFRDIGQFPSSSEFESGRSVPDIKYEIFFQAGKGATEDEVMDVFKDLDIIHKRIICKNTHSFGFIGFSSENDMKIALSLSKKFVIGGREMFVRPYFKERNRNLKLQSEKDRSFTSSKRPHSITPDHAERSSFTNSKRPHSTTPDHADKRPKLSVSNFMDIPSERLISPLDRNQQFSSNQTKGYCSEGDAFNFEDHWLRTRHQSEQTERRSPPSLTGRRSPPLLTGRRSPPLLTGRGSPPLRNHHGRGRGNHFRGRRFRSSRYIRSCDRRTNYN